MYVLCSWVFLLLSTVITPDIMPSKVAKTTNTDTALNLVSLYSEYDHPDLARFIYSCPLDNQIVDLLKEISYFCWKDVSRVVFELEAGIQLSEIEAIKNWLSRQGLKVQPVFIVPPEVHNHLLRHFPQQYQATNNECIVSSGS